MPELGLFQWIIGGIVAAGLAVVAYLNGRINTLHDETKDNELSNTKLRLHVAENYSTKEETKSIQSQMQHSLDRIHERMDGIDASIKQIPQIVIELQEKLK